MFWWWWRVIIRIWLYLWWGSFVPEFVPHARLRLVVLWSLCVAAAVSLRVKLGYARDWRRVCGLCVSRRAGVALDPASVFLDVPAERRLLLVRAARGVVVVVVVVVVRVVVVVVVVVVERLLDD